MTLALRPAAIPRHPLDDIIRRRLHLTNANAAALRLIRTTMHLGDAINRTLFGQPFFALRESENILHHLAGKNGPDLIGALLRLGNTTRFTPHGLDHVPGSGPVVIASTHPTGMFDFIAHATALQHKRADLKVVANRETEGFLGPDMIIPLKIDRHNRARCGKSTRRAMLAHLETGGALLIFGSGRVPDRRGGHLVEPDWRNGATKISAASGARIIPAALDARNSGAYYRTRALARFLSGGNDDFGAMIGSLRYMAELLEKLGGRYDVHYGAPLEAGTAPQRIKTAAEGLVPGLYGVCG